MKSKEKPKPYSPDEIKHLRGTLGEIPMMRSLVERLLATIDDFGLLLWKARHHILGRPDTSGERLQTQITRAGVLAQLDEAMRFYQGVDFEALALTEDKLVAKLKEHEIDLASDKKLIGELRDALAWAVRVHAEQLVADLFTRDAPEGWGVRAEALPEVLVGLPLRNPLLSRAGIPPCSTCGGSRMWLIRDGVYVRDERGNRLVECPKCDERDAPNLGVKAP